MGKVVQDNHSQLYLQERMKKSVLSDHLGGQH